MSDQTKIEWATHTFNPWIGCTKVSPGCAHCYAEARDKRLGGGKHWGKGAPRQRTSAATWRNPIRWNADVEREHRNDIGPWREKRPRVFPSLCDWLDDEVPIEWLADFLNLIHETPNLDWLLLTKRPENWLERLDAIIDGELPHDAASADWQNGHAPPNVWIGVSVENQKTADERIPELMAIPAAVRFLSVEPLLGPIDLGCQRWLSFNTGPNYECEKCGKPRLMVDWVIVGGESGPKARPCNIEWIRSTVRQCKTAGVPCFVKQLGSKPVTEDISRDGRGINIFSHQVKHPKGGDPSEWPGDLRIREFPSPSPILNPR